LIFLLPATLVACGKPPQGPPPRGPSNVTVMAIAPREVPVSYEFVAQTQSPRAVNIHARVSGFLDRRVYTEGALVKAGQVLFLMDKKPFQAQLDQAKAALQQQKAAMENAQAKVLDLRGGRPPAPGRHHAYVHACATTETHGARNV
jgi:membrane fusion protein (multidrug efflux system)